MSACLRITLCLLLCALMLPVHAQQIQLNEVVPSNSTFIDEDGDTPDWFELYNSSSNTISLEGWTITDKEDNPTKWSFPSVTIAPDEYLYIWASGKDKRQITTPRTLINRNEDWKYIIPSQPIALSWIDLDFNDTNWLTGKTGFGYSDNDDVTTIPAGSSSVFMRKKFDITDKNLIDELILDIDYDDAFVAYINGVEVARANIEGNRPEFDDYSITDHEAQIYSGGRPDRFLIPIDVLQDGENVLCIQAHNVSAFSSDFTMIPFLSALYLGSTNEGISPPNILNLRQGALHTNFKISAEETLFLFDVDGVEVDRLQVDKTPPDVSRGRRTQDNTLVLFDPPTPGTENVGNGHEGYLSDDIIFSHPGGIVDNLQLILSNSSPQQVIRYTLDATTPDSNSPVYQGPISINETTIVRARTFRDGFIPSRTQSNTYLTDVSHDIPIVSLVTDPKNLFDNDTGIYELGDSYDDNFPFFGANFWEDWERDINFTLFEDDNSIGVNFDAGVKIFGGWSRAQDQRSFSIFARGKYGTSEINYPLFPDKDFDQYQALVLRNSGNDFLRSNIRDGVLTTLMNGSGLETQAFRPVATYINGEYWGLYNMREKVNEHFLASRHNVNPEEIDLMGPQRELILGDDSEYVELHNYLENNSLQSDSKYQVVADQIDVENFIIYYIAQIYFDNTDWPGNNIKYWKPKDGKWRWILYDTDFGFGIWNPGSFTNNTLEFALEPNGPFWPNPPSSTLMLRRLVENETFRYQFINRFADELNSRFLPNSVIPHIEEIASHLENEMVKHYSRWGGFFTSHNDQVEVMKNYANFRPSNVKSHIKSTFGLTAFHKLTLQINNTSAGYIKLNSLTIENPFWQGDYFENVPIKIRAVAKPGYRFSHWSGGSDSTNPELIVDMESAMSLNAIFEESSEEQNIVINEINYNSKETKDAGDWVELYNPNNYEVELTDWVFTDSDIEEGYSFLTGTKISGGDYLIITRDQEKFVTQYPNVENLDGDIGFGLSNGRDNLRLYDNGLNIKDSVWYDSKDPWPEMADGLGYTLELKSPDLDNALAENWSSINISGSPGRANEESTSAAEISEVIKLKIYPNPFTNNAIIEFNLEKSTSVKMELYDAHGSMVRQLLDGKITKGDHKLINDFRSINSGMYFLKLTMDNSVEAIKWIKI